MSLVFHRKKCSWFVSCQSFREIWHKEIVWEFQISAVSTPTDNALKLLAYNTLIQRTWYRMPRTGSAQTLANVKIQQNNVNDTNKIF